MTAVARSALAGVTLALILVACGGPKPSPSGSQPIASASGATTAPPSLPTAARPYDAAELLTAMRASRRPGGVPDELETAAVATALANAIWTYDGRPYPSLVVGGSCGPATCTVEVTGAPAGAAGADLYAFTVTPRQGTVALLAADLHGYPGAIETTLDRIARDSLEPDLLDGLALTGATWQLPPRTGYFKAAYRSGGEEGSPGLDVVIDLGRGTVIETNRP